MQTIIIPHSLLIQTDGTGAIVSVMRASKKAIYNEGEQVTPWELCDPEDLPFPLDAQALGEVNAGLLLRIEQLTAAHAAEIEQLRAKLTARPALDQTATVLAQLDEAFETLIPGELQHLFEAAWSTVRNLLQADKRGRAINYIATLPVPAELIPIREQIVTMLSGDDTPTA
jgi:hypothetical protein